MTPGRLAAIDVGTNSIRAIVVEAKGVGDFRVLDDERAMVRLGEGLTASGRLSPAAFGRAREVLLRMSKIVEGFGVCGVEAVATSAVRNADNGQDFVEAMERDTGVRIRVISGEEEAELAALSARHHFEMANARHALLDIGGGSVEVVKVAGAHIEELCSLDLGTVFLTERFLHQDPIAKKELTALRDYARKQVRARLPGGNYSPQLLVGSGGTVTSIGTMVMALRGERYDSVHGYEILRSEVVHLLAMLQHKSTKERKIVPGLSAERADIIVAGVAVVDLVMEHLGANVLTVNERGIREGLILTALRRHGFLQEATEPRDWRTAAAAFARSCHVDLGHAEHVRDLSLALFEAVALPFGLGARARDLLEAAALLHDVGYFISYAKHHKHSYHLVRHGDLLGFSPREKEIIANVARYHRKALPKQKHEGYGQLSPEDRALVRRLGGLVRLADGLDRRRVGQVQALRCRLGDASFHVDLKGKGDISVELHGGREKGDLFEVAFRRRLVLAAADGALRTTTGRKHLLAS